MMQMYRHYIAAFMQFVAVHKSVSVAFYTPNDLGCFACFVSPGD